MSARPLALPEGRAGQALALAVTALALALLWISALSPLYCWFSGRAAQLQVQQQELAHTIALRRGLPSMRTAAAASARQADATGVLLSGGSDAIAGANLQTALQSLASQAGTSLDSIAMVPPQPAATLRRIGVEVSVTATWPVLTALLAAIDAARPRMIVDGLTVTSPGQTSGGQDAALQAGFTVTAFRAGNP